MGLGSAFGVVVGVSATGGITPWQLSNRNTTPDAAHCGRLIDFTPSLQHQRTVMFGFNALVCLTEPGFNDTRH